MRAKMSDPRHYDLCQCVLNQQYYGFGCQCTENAVAEARAILAETEPVTGEGPSPFNPKARVRGFYLDLAEIRNAGPLVSAHYGPNAALAHFDASEALAESLTAFVEA